MSSWTDLNLKDSSVNLKPWTLIMGASSFEEKQNCGVFPFKLDHTKLQKCAFNFTLLKQKMLNKLDFCLMQDYAMLLDL